MTNHWAVMNDTGEVIAQGDTFEECLRKAFATRRWVDPNTGEFMPAGSTCPYRLQTWEPVALAETEQPQ